MVIQRRYGQLDPGHAPHLFGPKTGGIDHMFASHGALFGDNLPAIFGLVQFQHAVIFDHLGATFFGRTRIGMHGARGIDIALAIGPHAAQNIVG